MSRVRDPDGGATILADAARLDVAVTGAPTSLVTLVRPERQFSKSAHGLAGPWATMRETPLAHSFCRWPVRLGERLAVEDARERAAGLGLGWAGVEAPQAVAGLRALAA